MSDLHQVTLEDRMERVEDGLAYLLARADRLDACLHDYITRQLTGMPVLYDIHPEPEGIPLMERTTEKTRLGDVDVTLTPIDLVIHRNAEGTTETVKAWELESDVFHNYMDLAVHKFTVPRDPNVHWSKDKLRWQVSEITTGSYIPNTSARTREDALRLAEHILRHYSKQRWELTLQAFKNRYKHLFTDDA